jgi:hypothetical protein
MIRWMFIVIDHRNNSPWIDMSLQPVFALTLYCCVLSGEATYTSFTVFGLTRSVLEPTTYRTRCEHTNHYVTDAVTWYANLVSCNTSSNSCLVSFISMCISSTGRAAFRVDDHSINPLDSNLNTKCCRFYSPFFT